MGVQADDTRTDWLAPALTTDGFPARLTPGTGGSLRWLFSGIWLVYLVAPVSGLFGHHHGALWIAGGVAIAGAFCVIYVPSLALAYLRRRASPPSRFTPRSASARPRPARRRTRRRCLT